MNRSLDNGMLGRSRARIAIHILLLMFFVFSSVAGLVHNSGTASQKYDTLIAVDKAGGDVETALNDLRGYIYSHMNTQIGSDTGIQPPIQLQGTYERLVAGEEARVKKFNDDFYLEAQEKCEARGLGLQGRIACIEDMVGSGSEKPKEIDESFYKFDFVPPRWSPDIAGLSIVAAAIMAVVLVFEIMLYYRAKRILVH